MAQVVRPVHASDSRKHMCFMTEALAAITAAAPFVEDSVRRAVSCMSLTSGYARQAGYGHRRDDSSGLRASEPERACLTACLQLSMPSKRAPRGRRHRGLRRQPEARQRYGEWHRAGRLGAFSNAFSNAFEVCEGESHPSLARGAERFSFKIAASSWPLSPTRSLWHTKSWRRAVTCSLWRPSRHLRYILL